MENVSKIKDLSEKVAAQHDDMKAAFGAQLEAEGALLEEVLTAIKPALRALSSPALLEERTTGQATDRQRCAEEWSTWRGILLCGGFERDQPRDNEGVYVGEALYLCTDGKLRTIKYSGSWSKWQGSSDIFETAVETWPSKSIGLHVARVAPDYGSSVAEIVERIQAMLESQLAGKAPERAKQARARAEKLRALVTLL